MEGDVGLEEEEKGLAHSLKYTKHTPFQLAQTYHINLTSLIEKFGFRRTRKCTNRLRKCTEHGADGGRTLPNGKAALFLLKKRGFYLAGDQLPYS